MKPTNTPPLLLCLLLSVLLMGNCSGSHPDEVQETSNNSSKQLDLIGHWESSFADDGEVSEERLALTNEMMGGMMKYQFLPGNKVRGQVAGYESDGTYTLAEDGKQIKLLFSDGSELELEVMGTKLVLEMKGTITHFTKVTNLKNEDEHPLDQMVLDRFNQEKKDRFYGLWELKRVSTRDGQVLSTLQQLEQGTFLTFHKDGTYTKHLTASRQVSGNFAKVDKRLTLISEFGLTQHFSITNLTVEVLTLQEEQADIVRYYMPIGGD